MDWEGNLTGQLDEHFSVVGGEIVATNASPVFDALAPQFGHTIGLECIAVSSGKYYDGHATLVHSGPRSVTMVLRHVDDLKNGVAPLRLDARQANDDQPLARTIEASGR